MMNFFYRKKLLIIKISIILILILIIMLPIYFLVIKKSTSKDQTDTPLSLNINPTFAIEKEDPNMLVFRFVSTTNSIDSSEKCLVRPLWDMGTLFSNADTGNYGKNTILNKWAYDPTNKLTIERTINNVNNAYTIDELNALGKTIIKNTYLVNKLIPIYNHNNPDLNKNIEMEIKPFILSLYSDCLNIQIP